MNKTKIHLVSKTAKGSKYGKRQKYAKVRQSKETGTRVSLTGQKAPSEDQGLLLGPKGSLRGPGAPSRGPGAPLGAQGLLSRAQGLLPGSRGSF